MPMASLVRNYVVGSATQQPFLGNEKQFYHDGYRAVKEIAKVFRYSRS